MTEGTTPERRLAALAVRLEASGLKAVLREDGVRVRNPYARGCCEDPRAAHEDTITCRPRTDDRDRLWFYTGQGEPFAEASDVTGAVMTIQGRLAPHEPAMVERGGDPT